ncbi:CopG family transcriptional regulator [Sphingobium yanoikuyae]|uniref:CopG family transcriptional regulator n=1 Tax=Sphingobium yanoikuyae TaxID=13690 RepID=UPI00084640FF|nr:CopG family transcriptional regulator [Sphingobium yanoikuyae]
MKIRQNLYIDRDICEELSQLARGHIGNKSRLANDALRSWLEQRRHSELDTQFKLRLDKLSRELEAARRDIDLLVETLALFIRYELMVLPPLAEGDVAGRARGRERFSAFVMEVGRQLAGGKRAAGEFSKSETIRG